MAVFVKRVTVMVAQQPGAAMSLWGATSHIPWFNPREMRDDTVMRLSTGRDVLCNAFLSHVADRLQHPATGGHWLVTGQRGGGKSYFLRLIQAHIQQRYTQQVRFVLLPEEHQNIAAPHELLQEIMRMRHVDQGDVGQPSAWRVADRALAWQEAKSQLLASLSEPLLIVGIENFDELLAQAFTSDEDQSLLRSLLSHESNILFLATSVSGTFDENYHKRLFKQFEAHELLGWTPKEHRIYLQNRAQLVGKIATPRQLARVEAYSRYTGGNPRVAAVLAGAIIDEQEVLIAAADIHATLDKMSEYYRALLQRVPANSKKILDALIRGGEPCSQSELANRLNAKQSDIARAVAWLHDYGYIAVQAIKGSKEKPYIMADRLFAQFYRMRYLQPGQQTQLAILAEFLTDALEIREKFSFAEKYFHKGQTPEAHVMLTLALQDHHIDMERLPEVYRSTEQLMQVVGGIFYEGPASEIEAFEKLLTDYDTDEKFRAAYQRAYEVLKACNRFGDDVPGQQLAELTDGSLSLSPVNKLMVLKASLTEKFSRFQWCELIKCFQEEVEKFNELRVEQPRDIATLEARHNLGKHFPLAPSYEHLAAFAMPDRLESHPLIKLEKSVQLSICALVHRLNQVQIPEAESVLSTINKIAKQLIEQKQYLTLSTALAEVVAISKPALNECVVLIDCIEWLAIASRKQDKPIDAIALHSEALALSRQQNATGHIAYNIGQIAWINSTQGLTTEALALHREALAHRQTVANEQQIAWTLGQIARLTLQKQDLAAAWQALAETKSLSPAKQHEAFQQLGDAISDISRDKGLTTAFAIANQLLAELPDHYAAPYEPFIRALWIDMVAMQTDRQLLRDLTAELVPIYGANLQPLADLLAQWLDFLDVPDAQRDDYLSRLNPDLASTLKALGEFT
ncbi:MAG: hypothetical protein HOP34_12790 [Methylococcaceae bacterium]|nr:hypothetical protein [Methylococcaceae bacterium]